MPITVNKHKHNVFYGLLTLLIMLTFARYAFQLEIPRQVLTAIVIIVALLGDRDEILAISFCCIPLHNAVDFYIAIAGCAVVYVLKNPECIRIGLTAILVIAIIIWEFLHCFIPGSTLALLLIAIAPLIYLIFILNADMKDINYAFVVRAMVIVCASMCVVLLVNCIVQANYDMFFAVANLRRLGSITDDNMIVGSAINPNSLGVINVCGMTALLQLCSVGQHKGSDLFLALFLLVFGALTSSRTFLVCLIIMAVLLIMGQPGGKRQKIQALMLAILIVVLALLILNWLFPETMEYYINRFNSDDITTGRDVIMSEYHRYILNNIDVMFFGIGLNNFAEKTLNRYQVSNNVPHNSIQETIMAWGIPGLIMVAVLFVMMINESKKYGGRKTILNYIPLVIILAKSMAGQLLTSGYTMLALALAYLSLCQDFSKISTQHKKRL